MKNNLFIIFVFLGIFLIAGCSLKKTSKSAESQSSEKSKDDAKKKSNKKK